MEAHAVVDALLDDLHRQIHESLDDDSGYALFVGPTDFPSVVHIEGPVDVDALAAAVLAVHGREPQSAPSERTSSRDGFARTAPSHPSPGEVP